LLLSDKQLKKEKPFTSLDQALMNPSKVFILDLSGQSLDSLPNSIGQLKNLQVLKLGNKIKSTTPRSVIRHSKRIGGGIMHLDRGSGRYVDYNHLTKLPETIKNLTKLQIIILSYNNIDHVPFELSQLKNLKYVSLIGCYDLMNKEKELKELKLKLPINCIFRTGTSIDYETDKK
jgi:leucine-rich repeat protein SHOC2